VPPLKEYPDSFIEVRGSSECDELLMDGSRIEWEVSTGLDDEVDSFSLITPANLTRGEVARVGISFMHEYDIEPPVEFKLADSDMTVNITGGHGNG
jgi:hypothetical protein